VAEKNALTEAFAKEKMALMNEACARKIRRPFGTIPSQTMDSLSQETITCRFVSRNVRVRQRLLRKRSAYVREKWPRAYSFIGKLFFRLTHFRRKS
jgi:hypothetical protein